MVDCSTPGLACSLSIASILEPAWAYTCGRLGDLDVVRPACVEGLQQV